MSLFDTFFRSKEVRVFTPSFPAQMRARDPWDLDFPLFLWGQNDAFTLRNAVESVAIFGELGAAKTTGSAAWLLLKYLRLGMGGLVCCVKPGDRELIEAYAKSTGREDSVIVVSPSSAWRCNLIRYALKRPGVTGSRVEQLVSLLMTIVEAAERSDRGSGQGDKFWQRSLRQILRNGLEVCLAAGREVTMTLLNDVITSAPRSHSDVHGETWQKESACYRLIVEAETKEKGEREQADFELAARYFLRDFPDLPNDTRGSILATYSVMADVLLRGHMADLFDGETNFVPDLTFDGAVVILDLPIKVYGQAGVYVQSAFTYLWQTACEQRDVKANPRPVFWFVDEAHELVSSYTSEFLATARSSRVASVLISQNKPNYLAAMGGEAGRHRVDAFLGNMGTKIFHANGDPETNRWASDTISEEIQTRTNWNASSGAGQGRGGGGEAVGRKVMPSEFTTLKKGGPQNGFVTEAVVYQTGASFAANNGEPWLRTSFAQQIPGVTGMGGKRDK
ncbi:type IV secretory system conjugative DNA transfer family protein [Paludibaculum fermentans]|uniref:type IV secretory system conjugative DNA transfer family protein n=1 Tax=Paludibaculum fermentans TaxID=1473598 RepID=UPI003EBC4740